MTLRELLLKGARFVRHPDFCNGHWFEFCPEENIMVEQLPFGKLGTIGGVPWGLADKEGWESK